MDSVYRQTNLLKIGQEVTDIHLFVYFQYAILSFAITNILGHSKASGVNVYRYHAYEILHNYLYWRPRYGRESKFRMASPAIWNFTENGVLGHSKPPVVNIYMSIKFDTNIFIGDRTKTANLRKDDITSQHSDISAMCCEVTVSYTHLTLPTNREV